MQSDQTSSPRTRELAQRLDLEGRLAFRRRTGWVVADVMVLLFTAAVGVGSALAHQYLFTVMSVVGLALLFPAMLEVWFAPGPAISVDTTGVHLARWRQPFTIAWHDVASAFTSKRGRNGPLIAKLFIARGAWTGYLNSRPWPLRLIERVDKFPSMTGRFAIVPLPHIAGLSAQELVDWLGFEIGRHADVPANPHLVLDVGTDGYGPVWFASTGRAVAMDRLSVSGGMAEALKAWNERGAALLDNDGEVTDPAAWQSLRAEAVGLAAHLQHELGQGATVEAPIRSS